MYGEYHASHPSFNPQTYSFALVAWAAASFSANSIALSGDICGGAGIGCLTGLPSGYGPLYTYCGPRLLMYRSVLTPHKTRSRNAQVRHSLYAIRTQETLRSILPGKMAGRALFDPPWYPLPVIIESDSFCDRPRDAKGPDFGVELDGFSGVELDVFFSLGEFYNIGQAGLRED